MHVCGRRTEIPRELGWTETLWNHCITETHLNRTITYHYRAVDRTFPNVNGQHDDGCRDNLGGGGGGGDTADHVDQPANGEGSGAECISWNRDVAKGSRPGNA